MILETSRETYVLTIAYAGEQFENNRLPTTLVVLHYLIVVVALTSHRRLSLFFSCAERMAITARFAGPFCRVRFVRRTTYVAWVGRVNGTYT